MDKVPVRRVAFAFMNSETNLIHKCMVDVSREASSLDRIMRYRVKKTGIRSNMIIAERNVRVTSTYQLTAAAGEMVKS